MSMTDTPDIPPPAEPKPVKPRRKPGRRPRSAAALIRTEQHAPVPATSAPSSSGNLKEATFAGVSATDCCNDCHEDRCVITGIGFCGHPMKGELQSALQNKPAIVARRKFVKLMLERMKLEAKER